MHSTITPSLNTLAGTQQRIRRILTTLHTQKTSITCQYLRRFVICTWLERVARLLWISSLLQCKNAKCWISQINPPKNHKQTKVKKCTRKTNIQKLHCAWEAVGRSTEGSIRSYSYSLHISSAVYQMYQNKVLFADIKHHQLSKLLHVYYYYSTAIYVAVV